MSRENTEFNTNENTQSMEIENNQTMTNECEMLNSPMLSIEKVEKILDQMKKSVCEINNFLSKCTGFFCKIKIDNNKEIIVLITALHGIGNSEKLILSNKEEEETKEIILDDSRIIYNDDNLDISIIEILSSDKINKDYCLEIDEQYIKENGIHNYNNISGYILGYPCGKECTFSFGKINVMEGNNKTNIRHSCSTTVGSSGSPIILLDNLKCIGIHLQGSNYSNSGNFLFSSVNSFINKYKKSYLTNNIKKLKLKNIQYNANIFNNSQNIKLSRKNTSNIKEVKEGSEYSNVESYNNSFVKNKINLFYCNLYKNKLDSLNIIDSSLSSGFIDTINNDIESLESNNKIEIRNINCKRKMIDSYENKENERLEKNEDSKNENKTNMNSNRNIILTHNYRKIKNDENTKTFKHLISSKKEYLKISPINSSNSNKYIFNTSNLDNNQVNHNDHINNLNKRINKKSVKRVPRMYDANNNNNNKININIENPLKNQILINKINEIKNNFKHINNNDFLNTRKLSPRNYMINSDILKASTQSIPKIIKTTN